MVRGWSGGNCLTAAVVVVEHIYQRHEHPVLVLVLHLATAAARATLRKAACLVREMRPHPRLPREDLGREHRRLCHGQRWEERGVLPIQVLTPLGYLGPQVGAQLTWLPSEGRAVALGQRVRIRAPPSATASQVNEVGVEHTASSDGRLRKVEMPRACEPEPPLPLDILQDKQVWLCQDALADVRGHRLVCGEHGGFRHRDRTVANRQVARGNQPPPVQLHAVEHHALQATPLEEAAFLCPLPGRRRHFACVGTRSRRPSCWRSLKIIRARTGRARITEKLPPADNRSFDVANCVITLQTLSPQSRHHFRGPRSYRNGVAGSRPLRVTTAATSVTLRARSPPHSRVPDARRMRRLALLLSAMVDSSLALSLSDLPQLTVGSSRLFLCRHGETDSNAQSLLQGSGIDAPLNDVGRAQASALARSLASIKMDLIASSTLSRAVETADIVASHQADTGAAVHGRESYAGLVEMFYGTMEGLPIADTREELKRLSDAWAAGDTTVAVGGDGESPDELLLRARATLWRDGLLGCGDAGRQVAVVAHSTFNRAVLAEATGQPLGSMFSIPQDNACVNVLDLEVGTGRVSVVALNIKPLA